MGMTPADLRERVKETIANGCGCDRYCERPFGDVCGCKTDADAAIALVLEEAAKVAKAYEHPNMALYNHQTGIAADIRALKEKNDA
jgi:hypothetical protein